MGDACFDDELAELVAAVAADSELGHLLVSPPASPPSPQARRRGCHALLPLGVVKALLAAAVMLVSVVALAVAPPLKLPDPKQHDAFLEYFGVAGPGRALSEEPWDSSAATPWNGSATE